MMENDCVSTDCPVHHRNDYRETFEAGRSTRVITYVGDYVVFTTDNPDLFTPEGTVEAVKLAMGLKANPPKLFTSGVYRVGPGGTLGPFVGNAEVMTSARVFSSTHGEMPNEAVATEVAGIEGLNKWVDDRLGESHSMIVEQVRDGIIPSGV